MIPHTHCTRKTFLHYEFSDDTEGQHSCLGNPMDRASWQATAHGSQTVGHDLATKQGDPKSRFKQFLIGEVKECRNKGEALKKQYCIDGAVSLFLLKRYT